MAPRQCKAPPGKGPAMCVSSSCCMRPHLQSFNVCRLSKNSESCLQSSLAKPASIQELNLSKAPHRPYQLLQDMAGSGAAAHLLVRLLAAVAACSSSAAEAEMLPISSRCCAWLLPSATSCSGSNRGSWGAAVGSEAVRSLKDWQRGIAMAASLACGVLNCLQITRTN